MNVVMTGDGATSRCRAPPRPPRSAGRARRLLALASKGCADLTAIQQQALPDE